MKDISQATDDKELIKAAKMLGIETTNDLHTIMARNFKFEISMNPLQWEKFDNFLNISKSDWTKIKYFDSVGNKSEELSKIPNNKGGIYIYYVKPDNIPIDNYCCIMYVGRAHFGEHTQNLRKRVNSYESEAKNKYRGRPNVRKLFNIYKDVLYVMYITIDGNENIDRMERELTMAIVPPANDDLFQKSLKDERKMF